MRTQLSKLSLWYSDAIKRRIIKYVYDFGDLVRVDPTHTTGQRRMIGAIEHIAVIALLIGLAMISRGAQYEAMTQQLSAYFLPGLVNVSTTNDAGLFLTRAVQWRDALFADSQLPPIGPGHLLPVLLGALAYLLEISLEEAGRLITISGTTLTAYSAFLLLRNMRQGLLGLIASVCLIFIWPVYSRTSVGMLDTDILNLFFLLAILATIIAAVGASAMRLMTLSAAAGLLMNIFFLWYGHAGFIMPALLSYLALMIIYSQKIKSILIGTLLILTFSGFETILSVEGSISSFIKNYLLPIIDYDNIITGAENFPDPGKIIWSTISEIGKVNYLVIRNDYGSIFAFGLSLIGIILWIALHPVRFIMVLPIIIFMILYFVAGQRFGFYSSVLVIVGFSVFVATAIKLIHMAFNRILDSLKQSNATTEQSVGKIKALDWPTLTLAAFSVLLALNTRLFPNYADIPPPTIDAREIRQLQDGLRAATSALTVSWWDYGYEIEYRTGKRVIVNPGSPASIKNIYIARALLSPNPYYAADEIRFAAYFEDSKLLEKFPIRPDLKYASNIDRDLYFFLPTDLARKMQTVYNIASSVLPQKDLAFYDPKKSTFHIMLIERPKRFGPFELVETQGDGGAALYKLPSPYK